MQAAIQRTARTHAFQFHLLKERGSQTRQAQPTQIPLWVVEGLAEYLSEGRHQGGLDAAMSSVPGQERQVFFAEFHAALRSACEPLPDAREDRADVALPLLNSETAA